MNVIRYLILKKSIGKIFIFMLFQYTLLFYLIIVCQFSQYLLKEHLETKQFNFSHKIKIKNHLLSEDMEYTIDLNRYGILDC